MTKMFAVCVTPEGVPANYHPVVDEKGVTEIFKQHAAADQPKPMVLELLQEPDEYLPLEDAISLTARAWHALRHDVQVPGSKEEAGALFKKGLAFARERAPGLVKDAKVIAQNPMAGALKYPGALKRLMAAAGEAKDYATAASKGVTAVARTARAKLDPTAAGIEIGEQKYVQASWLTQPGHAAPATPKVK